VLIVEREEQFRDRVRGEGVFSWGCAEAQKLGIYSLLLETCAIEKRWIIGLGPERDLRSTTVQRLPSIAFYHPRMQQVMIEAAAKAGAEVRRGSSVVGVEPGKPPVVRIQTGSASSATKARGGD
jgi:flavin-dependent dehydrogenase